MISHEWDIFNPQVGYILRHTSGVKKDEKLEQVLARNLNALMAQDESLNTAEKVEARSNKKIGKSSVDRIRRAEISPKLETVNALAEVFRVTPSALLSDTTDIPASRHRPDYVDIDEAVELLNLYRQATPEFRVAILNLARTATKINPVPAPLLTLMPSANNGNEG